MLRVRVTVICDKCGRAYVGNPHNITKDEAIKYTNNVLREVKSFGWIALMDPLSSEYDLTLCPKCAQKIPKASL